jgi:ABC-type nitrate/sulfonate/bicarbonate transport system ATPase subunit/ABC-type nitrate/sulfonate/bicarbonate transport system substrate-binding protein
VSLAQPVSSAPPVPAPQAPQSVPRYHDAIAFKDIAVTYSTPGHGARTVLSGIDLTIPRGQFTALVGRSGCGKTTLLNLVAGLVDPSAGSVTVLGQDPRAVRTRLGFMLARDALLPWRNARRNVEYGLELRGVAKAERRAIAEHWLAAVQLEHAQNLWPWQLSQGMRQRVALARTWALDPDVLLMDEPYASVDVNTRLALQTRFLDLWQSEEHRTVLFVTHDLTEAISLADRVVLLGAGRVLDDVRVEIDRPRDLATITMTRNISRSMSGSASSSIRGGVSPHPGQHSPKPNPPISDQINPPQKEKRMKITRRSIVGALGLVALAAPLAACGSSSSHTSAPSAGSTHASPPSSSAPTAGLTKVTVGDFPTSALTLPFVVAQDQGFFKAAGLDVQTVMSSSGPSLVSGLIGGTTQIAAEVPPNAFPVMQQGEPLVAMGPYGRLDLSLVTPANSGITNVASLQGKKIGVTARGAFTESFARYVLQQDGINPNRVTFVAAGTLLTQEAALRNHAIDAFVSSSDATAAADAHGSQLRVLASSLNGTAGALGTVGLQSFWATTTPYRNSHPAVVNAFCTAMHQSVAWLDNNANRTAGAQDIANLMNIPTTVAGQVWDTVHGAWSTSISPVRWSANAKLILGSPTSVPFQKFVSTGC